jgi:hypothetical protein
MLFRSDKISLWPYTRDIYPVSCPWRYLVPPSTNVTTPIQLAGQLWMHAQQNAGRIPSAPTPKIKACRHVCLSFLETILTASHYLPSGNHLCRFTPRLSFPLVSTGAPTIIPKRGRFRTCHLHLEILQYVHLSTHVTRRITQVKTYHYHSPSHPNSIDSHLAT